LTGSLNLSVVRLEESSVAVSARTNLLCTRALGEFKANSDIVFMRRNQTNVCRRTTAGNSGINQSHLDGGAIFAIKQASSAILKIGDSRAKYSIAGIILTCRENIACLNQCRSPKTAVVDEMDGMGFSVDYSCSHEKSSKSEGGSLKDRGKHCGLEIEWKGLEYERLYIETCRRR